MKPPSEVAAALEAVEIAEGSVATLAALAEVRRALAEWEVELARAALADGATWADIGEALGTSRQAAWERLRPAIAGAIESDRQRVRAAQAKAREKQRRTKHG